MVNAGAGRNPAGKKPGSALVPDVLSEDDNDEEMPLAPSPRGFGRVPGYGSAG